MNSQYKYIAIEGVIGAGKTSLAKIFAKKLDARLILESFEDNAFLPAFYKDPERYAFPVEMSFLADRYNQLKKVIKNDLFQPQIIADYFIDKSLIFSKTNLQINEFMLYRKLFFIMRNALPQPDIILYLHQSIENLKKNIKKRGRDYEKKISNEYLSSLHQAYMKHFQTIKDIPVLIVNTTNIDFVNSREDAECLFNILNTEYKNGLSYITQPKKI